LNGQIYHSTVKCQVISAYLLRIWLSSKLIITSDDIKSYIFFLVENNVDSISDSDVMNLIHQRHWMRPEQLDMTLIGDSDYAWHSVRFATTITKATC
jgi:hypothetical protein